MGFLRKSFDSREQERNVQSGKYIPASNIFQCPTLFWMKNNNVLSTGEIGIETEGFGLRATVGEVFERWVEFELLPKIPGISIIPSSSQLFVNFDLPYIWKRGRLDLLVEWNEKPYVLDVKAVSDWRFNNFVNNGFKDGNEKAAYAQMQVYLSSKHLHSILSPHELAGAILVYVNTNNNEWIDELVLEDKDFLGRDIGDYAKWLVEEVCKEDNPPDCGNNLDGFPCMFCPVNYLRRDFSKLNEGLLDIGNLGEEGREILGILMEYAETNGKRKEFERREEEAKGKLQGFLLKYKTRGFLASLDSATLSVSSSVFPKNNFDFNKFKLEENEVYRKYISKQDVLRINPPKVY